KLRNDGENHGVNHAHRPHRHCHRVKYVLRFQSWYSAPRYCAPLASDKIERAKLPVPQLQFRWIGDRHNAFDPPLLSAWAYEVNGAHAVDEEWPVGAELTPMRCRR